MPARRSFLRRVSKRCCGAPAEKGPADLINAVIAEVSSFVGAAEAFDDITMLALRRLTERGE
jgi:hypothetical protein